MRTTVPIGGNRSDRETPENGVVERKVEAAGIEPAKRSDRIGFDPVTALTGWTALSIVLPHSDLIFPTGIAAICLVGGWKAGTRLAERQQ